MTGGMGGGIIYEGKKLNYLFMEDGGKGIIEGHQKREREIRPRDDEREGTSA